MKVFKRKYNRIKNDFENVTQIMNKDILERINANCIDTLESLLHELKNSIR